MGTNYNGTCLGIASRQNAVEIPHRVRFHVHSKFLHLPFKKLQGLEVFPGESHPGNGAISIPPNTARLVKQFVQSAHVPFSSMVAIICFQYILAQSVCQ